VDVDCFFSFFISTQLVGLLGRGISPPQGLYLHTEQHEHRINAHNTNIHALSGIQTHDPILRESEDISCLRPRDQCDQPFSSLVFRSPNDEQSKKKKTILSSQNLSESAYTLKVYSIFQPFYLHTPPITVAARPKTWTRKLGSWIRIPLKAWMSVLCAFMLCSCCSVCR
jgi:hypothetical protein